MTDRMVNTYGEVVWDEAEEFAREQRARDAREGEAFVAATDCPWCGHVAVHWLDEPRFEGGRDDTPSGKAMRMINDCIDAMAVCAGGSPRRRHELPGTVVARVCVKCSYRWGQM